MTKHVAETLEAITNVIKIHSNIGQKITINTTALIFSLETELSSSIFNKTIFLSDIAKIRLPSRLSSNMNNSDSVLLRVRYICILLL